MAAKFQELSAFGLPAAGDQVIHSELGCQMVMEEGTNLCEFY